MWALVSPTVTNQLVPAFGNNNLTGVSVSINGIRRLTFDNLSEFKKHESDNFHALNGHMPLWYPGSPLEFFAKWSSFYLTMDFNRYVKMGEGYDVKTLGGMPTKKDSVEITLNVAPGTVTNYDLMLALDVDQLINIDRSGGVTVFAN
jgi:hypothetical protein